MTNGHPDGVTAAKGFQAAGVHCGLKKMKKDLALVYSTVPAVGAAIFTTSKVQAAPVMVDKMQFKKSSNFRAIVVNSGNANACTGERGLNDAWSMAKEAAGAVKIQENEILVSSTGVIGQYMPMEKISAGIAEASMMLGVEGHASAAEAIMTTDTFPKEHVNHVDLNGIDVTIGGMAKGSGMIAPNMATMLAFITTDVNICARPPSILPETSRRPLLQSHYGGWRYEHERYGSGSRQWFGRKRKTHFDDRPLLQTVSQCF